MNEVKRTISPRLVVSMLLVVILIPLLPLLISWHWDWWEAWLFAAIYILGFVVSRVLAGRRNPDLLAERARMLQHADAAPWDKYLSPLVAIGAGLIPLAAGLDARFNWSEGFSLAFKILALAAILAGYALGTYALVENRFFSGVVRIQTDRGHRVVSSGPYRWVRHPGYAGALLSYIATPLFLDSAWAFLPAVFIVVALIIRTSLEDRTLRQQLNGYSKYARRVRFRLFPGIW